MSKNVPIEKYIFGVRANGGLLTNKPATFNGLVTFNGGTTGGGGGSFNGGTITADLYIQDTSATALAVGQNGTTNPAFDVDTSTATSATGISIKSAPAAGGVALVATSSATNEAVTINAKGTGTLTLQSVATGLIGLATRTAVTAASNTAFAVGPTGNSNPVLLVDSGVASVGTGVTIRGNAAGAASNILTISTGTNESLTINAKGTGSVTINAATALAAGGSSGAGVLISSTAGLGFYAGTGAPTLSALNGSLYVNTTATTTTTRLYVNNSGSGTVGTTWTAFTSAA